MPLKRIWFSTVNLCYFSVYFYFVYKIKLFQFKTFERASSGLNETKCVYKLDGKKIFFYWAKYKMTMTTHIEIHYAIVLFFFYWIAGIYKGMHYVGLSRINKLMRVTIWPQASHFYTYDLPTAFSALSSSPNTPKYDFIGLIFRWQI